MIIAAGDKVNTLNSFMEKTEKKRLDREAAKDKVQYAIRMVDDLLKQKLARHQRQRVERSPMSDASKFAKVGDEFNLRVQLEEGYPVDQRDGVVSVAVPCIHICLLTCICLPIFLFTSCFRQLPPLFVLFIHS